MRWLYCGRRGQKVPWQTCKDCITLYFSEKNMLRANACAVYSAKLDLSQRVTNHMISGVQKALISGCEISSKYDCILRFFVFFLWPRSTDFWLIFRYIQQIFFNILLKSVRYLIEIWSIFSWYPFIISLISGWSNLISGEQISRKVLPLDLFFRKIWLNILGTGFLIIINNVRKISVSKFCIIIFLIKGSRETRC